MLRNLFRQGLLIRGSALVALVITCSVTIVGEHLRIAPMLNNSPAACAGQFSKLTAAARRS
jgi:hypothetical protein